MSATNQLVADIFTKLSHHRNISLLYLRQNGFDKNKYVRTITLNAHYLVLFKTPDCDLRFLRYKCIQSSKRIQVCHRGLCERYEGRLKEKGKEAYLYSAFYILCISQSAQACTTQFYLPIHHARLSFVCVHQMAPPLTEVRDI